MPSTRLTISDLTIRYSQHAAPAITDVTLASEPGELLALLGPSGSGKSTTLRCVAGFLEPEPGGVIAFDGVPVTTLPPEQRGTALVFQQPTLFPHLNVWENVAFGLRMRGVERAERRRRAEELLAAVQLAGYAERRPHQLSGGQRQRVALIRAIAIEPRVLLLDEPFAALDPELRDEMRSLVRRLQHERELTTLLVTHDQQEASVLADRIALLIDGRVQQVAPPETFYTRPANLAVARFFGAQNFLPGVLDRDRHTVATPLGPLFLQHNGEPPGPVTVIIRPEQVRLSDSATTDIVGRVCERLFLGTLHRYTITVGQVQLTALTTTAPFQIGDDVRVTLPPEHLWALPA